MDDIEKCDDSLTQPWPFIYFQSCFRNYKSPDPVHWEPALAAQVLVAEEVLSVVSQDVDLVKEVKMHVGIRPLGPQETVTSLRG